MANWDDILDSYLAEYETETVYQPGDIVRYHGSITEKHGTYVVVPSGDYGVPGSLALAYYDVTKSPEEYATVMFDSSEIAIWNVRPKSVTKAD